MTAGSFLHIARDDTGVDVEAAERAAADFLAALGIDVDHEDLRETPGRMARAYAELFSSPPLRLTTFANDEGYDELVLARAIPFRTICEHHLLPFSGVAHVGYLPGDRILGLSKLARLVGHFAARPQTQERLTKQVADCLVTRLRAPGVGVVLEAEHSCMTLRGARAHGAKTVTSALPGTLRADPGPGPSSSPWPACRAERWPPPVAQERITIMADPLAELSRPGVSIWLDDLESRPAGLRPPGRPGRPRPCRRGDHQPDHLRQGDHRRRRPTPPSSTSWPVRGVNVGQALRALTTLDVRWACDVFQPAYVATDRVDGRVSIEVDPRLAHDTAATIAEARALWWLVDRPNLFIKIPAAQQGLPAIAACLAEGISINVTLIFSLDSYDAVLEAFLAGLEQPGRRPRPDLHRLGRLLLRVPRGHRRQRAATRSAPPRQPRCAARPPSPTPSSPTSATSACSPSPGGPRCRAGARPQRPLWASTSVKDPAYSDTRYVTDLVAPGVVNTMPESTLRAVAQHGQIPEDSVRGPYPERSRYSTSCQTSVSTTPPSSRPWRTTGCASSTPSWAQLSDQVGRPAAPAVS